MEKKIAHPVFTSKAYYLLGKKDGINYWLESPQFDCKWYWGFGYVETIARGGRDIDSHQHFDGLFSGNYIDVVSYFDESPLTSSESWKLAELFKQYEMFRKLSDYLHTNGAHITTNPLPELLSKEQRQDQYVTINTVLLPSIMNEILSILSPNGKAEEYRIPNKETLSVH